MADPIELCAGEPVELTFQRREPWKECKNGNFLWFMDDASGQSWALFAPPVLNDQLLNVAEKGVMVSINMVRAKKEYEVHVDGAGSESVGAKLPSSVKKAVSDSKQQYDRNDSIVRQCVIKAIGYTFSGCGSDISEEYALKRADGYYNWIMRENTEDPIAEVEEMEEGEKEPDFDGEPPEGWELGDAEKALNCVIGMGKICDKDGTTKSDDRFAFVKRYVSEAAMNYPGSDYKTDPISINSKDGIASSLQKMGNGFCSYLKDMLDSGLSPVDDDGTIPF